MESNEIKQLKLVDKVTKYSFISFVVLTILAILLFVTSLLLSAKPAHAYPRIPDPPPTCTTNCNGLGSCTTVCY